MTADFFMTKPSRKNVPDVGPISAPPTSNCRWPPTSRKHLRTKVTPDFHLTYSIVKMGDIWGQNQNDKNGKFSIFLHKIICCECVL